MELFLDIDGVILDFESSFVDFIRDEYLPDLPADYTLQTWEVSEEFKNLDVEAVWSQFVNCDRFSRMDLLVDPGSFNELSARFPLYLVTNIPRAQYAARSENLGLYNLHYQGLYLAGHFNFGDDTYPSKSQIIKELHNPTTELVFLDDHPKNCLDIKRHFPQSYVFLMDRPHNRKADDPSWTRVRDWNEFNAKIVPLAN
jgi:uncharacterized HAD superfamily protein